MHKVPLYYSKRINYCSEASAQMLLAYYGIYIDQDDLHRQGLVNFLDIPKVLSKYLKGVVLAKADFTELLRILKKKPVIVRICTVQMYDCLYVGHSIVLTGYDNVWLYANDPDLGYVKIERKDFIRIWTGYLVYVMGDVKHESVTLREVQSSSYY